MTTLHGTTPATRGGSQPWYLPYLLLIAGMGGLLFGIDIGIISAALLYLDKTISLTESQTSFIVAAVLGGSMISSLAAGLFADWLGRKKMTGIAGLMFVVSILLIYTSQGFMPLFLGRLLMGLSGGIIGIVVPLYLVECLTASSRGKGIAIFQFMVTFGIAAASVVGVWFTRHHDLAVNAAAGNPDLILAADNFAWRGMFLVAIVPGILYTLGTLLLTESPRWLFRRGRRDQAEAVLCRSRPAQQARLEVEEMEQQAAKRHASGHTTDSLLQRKYLLPFIIACLVLALTQATGAGSILQYLALILKQAGMSDLGSAHGDLIVKILNCVMTLIGVALVDRMGRKFLLKLGTAGIVVALVFGGLVYRQFESKRLDVNDAVAARVSADGRELSIRVDEATLGRIADHRPTQLSVLYRYDKRQGVATAFSNDKTPVLVIQPKVDSQGRATDKGKLVIERAKYGPVPSETTGWLITAALCLFISSFAAGPGVCVWLALSELMPTRIRSFGMGFALLLNSFVSTSIAAVFLPTVGNYGYAAMFFFWAGCTVVYFITAAFVLPETKGKTLEEIEQCFEGTRKPG